MLESRDTSAQFSFLMCCQISAERRAELTGIAFHAFVLFSIFSGFKAFKQIAPPQPAGEPRPEPIQP